jgi:hypothetical protein
MGRKLLQAHLDMRQPGQAVEPVRDAAGTPLTSTPVQERSIGQSAERRHIVVLGE